MAKKILHIIVKSRYDGVTSYSIRLIKNLPQFKHQILSCYKGEAISEIAEMKISCSHLVNSNKMSFTSLPRKYIQSILFFIKNDFDVCHYHQGGLGVLFIAVVFGKKAKIIHHLHGGNLIGDNSKQEISFIHLLLLNFLSKRTYQIAVANHVFDEYKLKIKTVNNIKSYRNSVPYNFQQKTTRKYAVGYIGRFTKEKGFGSFLSVSEQIKLILPKINVVAMGGTNISNKNVNIIPPSFNVTSFYERIDLLLFTSTATEGLPLVILEAVTFDVGVIAFPLKGVVEILGENYPLLINNVDELVLQIEKFYSEKFDKTLLSDYHYQISKKFIFSDMIEKIGMLYSPN